MAVLSMSKQEFSRLDVLLQVQSGRLRIADACTLIGLQRRQVFRLLRGLKQDGAPSLLSKRRGKASNHRLPAEVRVLALKLVRERYADFGPTFAAEKLADLHGCSVSRETLRGWMIADGLWIDRRHRLAAPHQPRRRRECLGELVQIDGSEHAWFEDRGDICTLLAFVDDATSRSMQLRFVASESAFDYFRACDGGEAPANRDGRGPGDRRIRRAGGRGSRDGRRACGCQDGPGGRRSRGRSGGDRTDRNGERYDSA